MASSPPVRPPAPQWVGVIDDLGVSWRGAVAIAGEEAPAVAAAYRSIGAPTAAHEAPALVVLGDVEVPHGAVSVADLPDRCAQLVVLRRPWKSRSELKQVLRQAARVLGFDGMLLAAEINAVRLLTGSTVRYPSRLQYLIDPEAGDRLRSAVVERTRLALEMNRAGFVDVVGRDVDEDRGRYGSVEEYWQAVRGGVWRSFAEIAPRCRQEIPEAVADDLRRLCPAGEVIDREPWYVVSGRH